MWLYCVFISFNSKEVLVYFLISIFTHFSFSSEWVVQCSWTCKLSVVFVVDIQLWYLVILIGCRELFQFLCICWDFFVSKYVVNFAESSVSCWEEGILFHIWFSWNSEGRSAPPTCFEALAGSYLRDNLPCWVRPSTSMKMRQGQWHGLSKGVPDLRHKIQIWISISKQMSFLTFELTSLSNGYKLCLLKSRTLN